MAVDPPLMKVRRELVWHGSVIEPGPGGRECLSCQFVACYYRASYRLYCGAVRAGAAVGHVAGGCSGDAGRTRCW